jgi:hypothetical protein
MKKSEYDKLIHELEILEKKINALRNIRAAIADLHSMFANDSYALEFLIALDKTIFNWLKVMFQGREKLIARKKELEKQQQQSDESSP